MVGGPYSDFLPERQRCLVVPVVPTPRATTSEDLGNCAAAGLAGDARRGMGCFTSRKTVGADLSQFSRLASNRFSSPAPSSTLFSH